jgi:TFIIF-interacting CTD phosphatase-like protein
MRVHSYRAHLVRRHSTPGTASLHTWYDFTALCRYAEKILKIVDPDGKFFGSRMLSRDEQPEGNSHSKTENLAALFPSGASRILTRNR